MMLPTEVEYPRQHWQGMDNDASSARKRGQKREEEAELYQPQGNNLESTTVVGSTGNSDPGLAGLDKEGRCQSLKRKRLSKEELPLYL